MTNTEKIRAEIKRLINNNHTGTQEWIDAKECAYMQILCFIDSLQQEQPDVDLAEEISDKSRACCNCVNGIPQYPNCYCWQHKYCNTDEPYKIPKENWVETAKKCKEFEFEPELNTVLINARKEE